MTLPTPKIIIFDWDNTLVDTWPVITRALNATLAFMGHEPWTAERVKRDVKHSMRDSFPALFGDQWEVAAERYQTEYRAIHMEAIQPLADAEAALKQLRDAGLYITIVSNKRNYSLTKELGALNWNAYFKAYVGSQDAERDKPDPAPVRLGLKDAPAHAPEDVWFVGDSSVDLECAKNIGAVPIFYGDGETSDGAHQGFAFDAHVKNHAELQALFKRSLG